MSDVQPQGNDLPKPHNAYTHGYDSAIISQLASRTAAENAAFLLPHLQSGMHLLDCGCGPGAITVGLAEVVAPGEVIGVDLSSESINLACDLARQRKITNIRFDVANVYALPFADATFDAVFAHTLLEHVNARLVITEMCRVLKPGGVIGIRDTDWSTRVLTPELSPANQLIPLYVQVMAHNGASPTYARHQRALLMEAGCSRTIGFAYAGCAGNEEATQAFNKVAENQMRKPEIRQVIIEQGWADENKLEAIIVAFREWSNRQDALTAWLQFAAVGWKDKS